MIKWTPEELEAISRADAEITGKSSPTHRRAAINARDLEVLQTIADCDLNISETARRMYMYRNAVVYHCDKFKTLTGLNPRHFWDLNELLRRYGLSRDDWDEEENE